MPRPIPPIQSKYTQKYYGAFGKLGDYATKVKYLQTTIKIDQLDQITRVDTIPGSQEWGVRELFQRGINIDRVNNEINNYFMSTEQQKFFNPLTIALLPMENGQVVEEILEKGDLKDDEIFENEGVGENALDYKIIEAKDFYKFRILETATQYSEIHINPDKVELVAIDGQHRLTSLKKLYAKYKSDSTNAQLEQVDFINWTIPIILLAFPVVPTSSADILKSMRNIFITINKQAKEPTFAQNILLDDFDVNAICTQELLNKCHSEKKNAEVPLLYFDWMGAREMKNKDDRNISHLDIEELYHLHENYFIRQKPKNKDERISQKQYEMLNIEEIKGEKIDTTIRGWDEDIRDCYAENNLSAIIKFFSNFLPTKQYIDFLKKLEEEGTSDSQENALYKIKFGSILDPDNKSDAEKEAIEIEIAAYKRKSKQELDKIGLFKHDIGLRGVLSAFKQLYKCFKTIEEEIPKYEDFMDWFIKHINKVYEDGHLIKDGNELLDKIALNQIKDWQIINYKHSAQDNNLGAYCSFFVSVNQYKDSGEEKWLSQSEDFLSVIESKLKTQYRYDAKRENPDSSFTGTPSEYQELIRDRAQEYAMEHIKKIRNSAKI